MKMPRPTCGQSTTGYKKAELTLVQRRNIFFTAVQAELTGGIKRGFFKTLSSKLPVSARTVSVTWYELRAKYEEKVGTIQAINLTTMMTTLPDEFFATNKKKTGQNSRYWEPEMVSAAMLTLPKSQRMTLRSTAHGVDVPRSTFHRLMVKEGVAVAHTSSVKPILNEDNKLARVHFALSRIEERTINGRHGEMKYKDDMYDISVDEKWFDLTKETLRYYLAPGEAPPERRCKHKSHIDRIMFLSAIARPRKLPDGSWWDGKLGIWPFGRYIPAQRSSCKRPKGTLVWTNENVDMEVYRSMLMNEVVPAFCQLWPAGDFRNAQVRIRIQQDGAKAHCLNSDPVWQEYLREMGLEDKLSLFEQPANSPDLNHNDLGFFNALEKSYKTECPKTMEDIIKLVNKHYWEYPHNKINRIWLTRQQIMNEILECNGDNTYKIPHMNKEKLEREGTLPLVLKVSASARNYL
jgi:hypothetical protein